MLQKKHKLLFFSLNKNKDNNLMKLGSLELENIKSKLIDDAYIYIGDLYHTAAEKFFTDFLAENYILYNSRVNPVFHIVINGQTDILSHRVASQV